MERKAGKKKTLLFKEESKLASSTVRRIGTGDFESHLKGSRLLFRLILDCIQKAPRLCAKHIFHPRNSSIYNLAPVCCVRNRIQNLVIALLLVQDLVESWRWLKNLWHCANWYTRVSRCLANSAITGHWIQPDLVHHKNRRTENVLLGPDNSDIQKALGCALSNCAEVVF